MMWNFQPTIPPPVPAANALNDTTSEATSITGLFGFLPFKKPKGMTSRDLANRVQRRLRREAENRKLKVGHTGTLDPLASGLVILAVGAATRLTPWMLKPTKRYTGTFRLGAYSESGDLEEPVTEVAGAPIPSRSQVEAAITRQLGWIDQTPPTHSAIWVDGQRAHERVRRGEEVEMPTRRVWIESIELIRYDYPFLEVDVTCGSGTYLRSLGNDIAQACQTTAVMTDLIRTEAGNFQLGDAAYPIPPNDPPPVDGMPLRHGLSPMTLPRSPWLCDHIVSPVPSLAHMPSLQLDEEDARRVRHGLSHHAKPDPQPPTCHRVTPVDQTQTDPTNPSPTEIICLDPDGDLVAIMRLKKDQWEPYRVFAPTTDRLQS